MTQHLSEQETNELLTRKKQELAEEKQKYEEQRKMNLELFHYKYGKEAKPDNSKAKSIIKKLKQKGKYNPTGFAFKVVKL